MLPLNSSPRKGNKMSNDKQKVYVTAPLGEMELDYIKQWDEAVSQGKVTIEAATEAILKLPQLSLTPPTIDEISDETVEEFADTVGEMVNLSDEDLGALGDDCEQLVNLCKKEKGVPNTLFYSKEEGLSSGPLLSTNEKGITFFVGLIQAIYDASKLAGVIPSMVDVTLIETYIEEKGL